jgi:opacity protein-like surface antigen
MGRAKTLALAGAAALMSTASLAADVTLPRMRAPIPVPVVTGGWYLRGYIGSGNEFLKEITHPDFLTAPSFGFLDKGGFDAAPFGGGGIGYQWNNWFRVDATLEYRGFAQFHALDRFFNPFQGFDQFGNPNPGRWNTNQYTASKSELIGLVNAFVDLGTWWCITPYIGAGAGFAQIKIDHFRDVNVMQGAGGWADTGTKTNFAWALHAGLAYKVTERFAVELGYRYLNVGNADSGTLLNLDPTVFPNTFAPVTFHNIQSHDIILGMRWMLQPEAPLPIPLIRKG